MKGVYQRDGSWYVRYKVAGKDVRKSFGSDLEGAEDYAQKAQSIAKTGLGVRPATAREHVLTDKEIAARRIGVTVGEIADEWLLHIQRNPQEYKDQLNPPRHVAQIKARFGSQSATNLASAEIDDWLDQLAEERELKPATINRIKAAFSGIYSRAMRRSRVNINPVRAVHQRTVNNAGLRWLTPEEETRLRAAIVKTGQTGGKLAQYQPHWIQHRLCELTFAICTGARKSEQYGLSWDDVDFRHKQVTFRDTKNGETRIVEMIDDVERALRTLQKLKLERREGKLNTKPVNMVFAVGDNKKWWAEALRVAKIKNLRWHDLRHTFCSRLAQAGVGLKVIQEAAGHKTIQMTARYAHLDRSTMRTAMAVLNRASSL